MDDSSLKGRVFLVEDEPQQLYLIQNILERNNFEVFSALNGEEALKKLLTLENLPDIIISDITMPTMDGYEFFKTVSENPLLNRIPFIFNSGLGSSRDIRLGKMLGVDDYITKPMNSKDLLAIVEGKILRYKKNRELNDKIDDFLTLEIEIESSVHLNKNDNIVLFSVFWDDIVGPQVTEHAPKNVELSFSLNKISSQLFESITSIYGGSYIDKADSILLNIKNIKRSGYIFFDAYTDNTFRGGTRDIMLAVIAPTISYFHSLKLKTIFTEISREIKNDPEHDWDSSNYWEQVLQVLL